MYPVYRFMEPHHEPCSLSHQRDHNSHPYHHYPTWDSMPTMHHNGMNMMNHPNPPDYNACCNKSYPYGFHGFRPPYPQYQPPPQFYYPGPYPPYPDPYQQPYFVPPNSHCCGCANHACHQKENTGVKIEEQSPEPEHKKSGDSSGFVQLPNYPYPVVWVPPGYLNDRNINSLKNSVHGGEEKKKTQLPWPLVWMSGNDKPEEAVKELKEINATPKKVEEPPKFKIIPLKFLENGNEKENKESRENKVRSIPVKQVEEMLQGQTQVDDDKQSSIVEKPMEKEVKKSCAVEKPREEEVKKSCSSKQTSSTKSSKLPPVCLRVDPLPSKKRSNGSSRSPSSPGIKEAKDNAKKEIKVVEIKEKSPINVVKQVSRKVASDDTTKVMEALDDKKVERKSSEDEIVKNMAEEASDCKKVENKKIIKSLSESEAALLIQSAYRGYEVRRTQLLEKLRKIAHVRERIDDVRTQIQQLEASKEIDSKQRAILSEIVMNLLLQLDTIQGLHPDVRDVRKSVARELVCLQEKLDALGSHNSKTKSNDLDEVEKESKIKAPEDGIPTFTVTKPFDEKDGEKQEKKTEDDEQKSAAEMAEPPEHEQEGQSQTEGYSTDSKMLVESHSISDEKEKESVDGKDDKASDHLVSALHGEENDDKTIMQSEESSKMLDIQPVKLNEDSHEEKNSEMSCIEDEIEKIATTTPEIVPSQSESAEISEKLKLKEDSNEESSVMPCIPDVISENAVAVEGAAIEKIAEETTTMTPGMVPATSEEKPKLKEDSNEESSVMPCIPDVIAENAVAAEGAEIEKIAEETTTMTPEMVPAQSESAETSEEKPKLEEDSNEESSGMPCIPDVIAENVAAEGAEIEKITEETTSDTSGIVPAQREYTEICEEKTKLEEDINEDSSRMLCNAGLISDTIVAAEENELEMISEESAVKTPDIVPAKSESAEIPHDQSESLEPTSKQGSVDHVQGLVPEENRLMEENQKLREMVEKLLEAGKEQLGVISSLNGRVKDLERKLSQKKKPRVAKRPKKILTSNTLSTGNILSSAA